MKSLIGVHFLRVTLAFCFFFLFQAVQASPSNWGQLTEKVAREGRMLERGEWTFMVLEDTQPANKELDHVSNYFSGIGGVGPDGQASFFAFTVVSESWVTNSFGNWQIDQWIFMIDLEGQMIEGNHYDLQLTKGGSVISDNNLGASAQELESKWHELKLFWESRAK